MRNNIFSTILLLICGTVFFSCSTEEKINFENMAVVAEKTVVNGSDFISCDVSKLSGTVDIPLSFFTEEMQIVKLDNRDEALVGRGLPTITDNYILVRNDKQNPHKLFDKQGKFITNIGAYGQGPNEYLNVYDDFLDEKNGQIFILPWTSDKILRFNLKGEALDPIRLPYRVPKGKIMVNEEEKTVSVVSLPFKGSVPLVAWTQDFEGKILDSAAAGHLAINTINEKGERVGYDNEIILGKNTNSFDVWLTNCDSLYNYNGKDKLDPKFHLDFKDKPRAWHVFWELPNHFVGLLGGSKYIVDKKTLKGAFFNIYDDSLGGMPCGLKFYNGYWVWSAEPGVLINSLEKQLKKNKEMSEKERKKLVDLIDSVNENDNNYVLYAKLKN